MPVKKVGSEKPMKANVLAIWSKIEYGPRRGVDADRQRDQQRQHLRRADHTERHRQALQDQRVDIHPADEGKAPVAMQHGHEPVQVAHGRPGHRGRTWRAAQPAPTAGRWVGRELRRTGRQGRAPAR